MENIGNFRGDSKEWLQKVSIGSFAQILMLHGTAVRFEEQ